MEKRSERKGETKMESRASIDEIFQSVQCEWRGVEGVKICTWLRFHLI
jgi:hypothetical protein